MSSRRLLLAALLALLAVSCSREPERRRVVVLGLDGVDPQVVDLLMSEGKLPHFARLRREGAYGRLRSQKPLLSPILWTTIATGRPPQEHGIGHFVAVSDATGEQLPVTSGMRRVKALWNVFSEAERPVGVVGWWATWPAERVRGALVSDHLSYHFLFEEAFLPATDQTGDTWPPELVDELAPLVVRPQDLGPDDLAPFDTEASALEPGAFSFEDDAAHLRWAIAAARTNTRVGLHLWEQQRPELLLVYVEATDSLAHLFGHLFRVEGLAGDLAEQQARHGGAVEAVYGMADEIVGRYLDALDDDTTLVVLSDHGFALGELHDDPTRARDLRRVSERYHRLDGILYLWGAGVKPRARVDGATLLDIAPTILALAGLPVARDMPGRVLEEALDFLPQGERVASYEDGGPTSATDGGSAVDPLILERLQSLGYVGASSPQSDRNLAALAFEAGRIEEAVRLYAEQVRERPDEPALRASYAAALGAAERYDEALAQIETAVRLNPLQSEAHHNRGVILERLGRPDEAVESYRAAARYQPDHQPSRQALQRLTGSAHPEGPLTPGQQLAAAAAERARQLATRGDYAAAARALDEAERLAPDFVLVLQYRSNVAFLSGDVDGAIAALERALEMQPENALLRQNLRTLRARREGAP